MIVPPLSMFLHLFLVSHDYHYTLLSKSIFVKSQIQFPIVKGNDEEKNHRTSVEIAGRQSTVEQTERSFNTSLPLHHFVTSLLLLPCPFRTA